MIPFAFILEPLPLTFLITSLYLFNRQLLLLCLLLDARLLGIPLVLARELRHVSVKIIFATLLDLLFLLFLQLFVEVFPLLHFFHVEQFFHSFEVGVDAFAKYGLDLQLLGDDILLFFQLVIIRPFFWLEILVIDERVSLRAHIGFFFLNKYLDFSINLNNDQFLLDLDFLLRRLLRLLLLLLLLFLLLLHVELVFIELCLLIVLLFFELGDAFLGPGQLLQYLAVSLFHF